MTCQAYPSTCAKCHAFLQCLTRSTRPCHWPQTIRTSAPATACVTLGWCAGLDPSDINNAPFLWHKGEDFQKAGTAISLMYRMATNADVKPPRGQKFSRYLWKMPVKKVCRPAEVSAWMSSHQLGIEC